MRLRAQQSYVTADGIEVCEAGSRVAAASEHDLNDHGRRLWARYVDRMEAMGLHPMLGRVGSRVRFLTTDQVED